MIYICTYLKISSHLLKLIPIIISQKDNILILNEICINCLT